MKARLLGVMTIPLVLALVACGGGSDSNSSSSSTSSSAAAVTPTVTPTSGPSATPSPSPSPTVSPTPGPTSVPSPVPTSVSAVAPSCTTTVTSSSAFTTALSTVQPGDTICVSGSYSSGLKITGKNGTSSAPITIRAATSLGTTLPSFEVNTSTHIVVRDFIFKSNSASTLLKIVGSTNIKALRNDFDFTGAYKGGVAFGQSGIVTSAKIVTDTGGTVTAATISETLEIAYNTFHDHTFTGNDFATKVSGSFIKTQVDDGVGNAPVVSKNLWIHHNYFKNIKPHISAGQTTPDGDSDRESIVFGTSESQQLVTNHTVENNLFEDCDGENEIITVKTSTNIIRYNTFKNSFGSVSVRFGHDTEVYGNYFFGEGASATYTDPNYQTGGIRVYGINHKIYNNYMQGLTGTTWRLPILLDSGDTDGTTGDSHQRPKTVDIAYNTIVDSAGGLTVGNPGFQASYTKKPSNNKIGNNLVVGTTGTLIDNQGDGTNTFEGNIALASGAASAGAANITSDPQLQSITVNGYTMKKLSSGSPAIGAAQGSYSYISKDIDGETRGTDIGADKYSSSTNAINPPLKATDVGTSAP